jgi:hypothetical protein
MKIISEPTLDLFRGPGRCEWCKKYVTRREPHHVKPRGMGAGSRLDVAINLIALCGVFTGGDNCHHEAEQGHILRADLEAIIAAREGLLQHQIRERIDALLRLPKGSKPAAVQAILSGAA